MNANVLVTKKWHIPFFSARKVAREHFRLSFSQTYLLALVIIGVLLMYYSYLQNQNATRGYNIRTLQSQYRDLAFKENILDIRIAEGRSIDVVMASDVVAKMENTSQSSFLVLQDNKFNANN